MRVVVAGGTGLVGHHVVHCLAEAGHDPVVVARSNAVDLATGEGLDAAMAGSEAVIDATNAESNEGYRVRFGADSGPQPPAGEHSRNLDAESY